MNVLYEFYGNLIYVKVCITVAFQPVCQQPTQPCSLAPFQSLRDDIERIPVH